MASTERLNTAAATGTSSEVEVALGRFKGTAAIEAAIHAADIARAAERWGNLAYLADFLADVTAHPDAAEAWPSLPGEPAAEGGADAPEEEGEGGEDCGCTTVAVPGEVFERGIMECVVAVTGKDPLTVKPADVAVGELDKIADCMADRILDYAVATGQAPANEPPDVPDMKERAPLHTSPALAQPHPMADQRQEQTEEEGRKAEPKSPKQTYQEAENDILRLTEDIKSMAWASKHGPPVLADEGPAATPAAAEEPGSDEGLEEEAEEGLDEEGFDEGAEEGAAAQGTPVATFALVDPAAKPGEYRSAEDPSPYVSLEDPEDAIAMMQDRDAKVVGAPKIRVLYSYPLGTAGPSPEEQEAGGWIFEEAAPNGQYFTRADLARAVAKRYQAIYAEEDEGTKIPPGMIPGMYNRVQTDGKYGIWGHVLGDLDLHTVSHDADHDLYLLGIDS